MTDSNDALALRLSAFVKEALELNEDPADLVEAILPFKRDVNAGISTIELDSSVGVAAFLIYHYALQKENAEGRLGQDIFQADLKTLERAAKLNTPGPRIMAHAVAGDEAYILATTPATHRALTGSDQAIGPAEPLAPDSSDRIRREAATELMRLLTAANTQARDWLAAIQQGSSDDQEAGDNGLIEFNEDEMGLALFLLDDSNIRQLLQVINLMLESARAQLPDQNGAAAAGTTNGE